MSNGENAASNAIQTALDNATPGDLVIVGPGNYNEMLVMWKPVRLQGVGSGAVKVNANTHPSGKMDAWRRRWPACLACPKRGLHRFPGIHSIRTATSPVRGHAGPGGSDSTRARGRLGSDLNGNLAELPDGTHADGRPMSRGITGRGKG